MTVAPCSFHVSCKNFMKVSLEHVEKWLASESPVPLQRVFKSKSWGFAFVEVDPEHGTAFREAVEGANFRGNPASVRDGNPRDNRRSREESGDAEAPKGKKQKVKDFPEGYIPTLKDLRDKEKHNKGKNRHESMLRKSAPLLEWPYETQLTMKGTYVKSAVRAFTKQVCAKCADEGRDPPGWATPEWSLATKAPVGCGCPMDAAIGTPEDVRTGYRNKCEFTIGKDEAGETEIGFVLRQTNDSDLIVAPCGDIPHVPEPMKKLIAALKSFVQESKLPVFDRRRGAKRGVWRAVMVRLTPNGEMLAMVQTSTLEDDIKESLVRSLVDVLCTAESGMGVVSLYMQFNDEATDAARPDAQLMHVHGKPCIEMPLQGLSFEIGPTSFFQSNTAMTGKLFGQALEWLCPSQEETVLDVCCGVGTIGLCAASRCKQVIGIEIVPEAVESARRNAELNNVKNATFIASKAEDAMPRVLGDLPEDCKVCAIVDPPRAGLHHQVTAALRGCSRLSRIVYISCNPDSLVDDVVRLTLPRDHDPDPFVPVKAVAVDMFPHTLHCEMVLLLERSSCVKDPRVKQDAVEG